MPPFCVHHVADHYKNADFTTNNPRFPVNSRFFLFMLTKTRRKTSEVFPQGEAKRTRNLLSSGPVRLHRFRETYLILIPSLNHAHPRLRISPRGMPARSYPKGVQDDQFKLSSKGGFALWCSESETCLGVLLALDANKTPLLT